MTLINRQNEYAVVRYRKGRARLLKRVKYISIVKRRNAGTQYKINGWREITARAECITQ